eukprot:scaffold133817_cov32-Tisochrysis_lutea.AAC.4
MPVMSESRGRMVYESCHSYVCCRPPPLPHDGMVVVPGWVGWWWLYSTSKSYADMGVRFVERRHHAVACYFLFMSPPCRYVPFASEAFDY